MVETLIDFAPLIIAALAGLLVLLVLAAITRRLDALQENLSQLMQEIRGQRRDLKKELSELSDSLTDQLGEPHRAPPAPPRVPEDPEPNGPVSPEREMVAGVEEEPPQHRPPAFSQDHAFEVYREWKDRRSRKPEIEGWEICWMRGSGKTQGDELTPGRQLLQDSEGKGDFVRFSEQGSREGLLFPNPHRELEPAVHGGVFAEAVRGEQDDLARGVRVVRREDGRWEPR